MIASPPARAIAWGGTRLIPAIHSVAGIAICVLPVIPVLAGGRTLLWRRAIACLDRERSAAIGYALGQRANAVLSAIGTAVLGATGIVILLDRAVSISLRESAYDVHSIAGAVMTLVALVHVAIALVHPRAMKAMLVGSSRVRSGASSSV
jgi:hypothetical protein